MSPFLTIFSLKPSIEFPIDIFGWIAWIIQAVAILYSVTLLHRYDKVLVGKSRYLLVLLLAAVPLTTLFLGLRIPVAGVLTPPIMPVDSLGKFLMVLSAIPWLLAAGLFGPTWGVILAVFAGILRALWDTHSPFTLLEYSWLAILFSLAIYQRYRTPFFRWLSQPLVAAGALVLVYPFLFFINQAFATRGAVVGRLDYALTHLGEITLVIGVELLIGGLFAQAVAILLPNAWGRQDALEPSPAERSLQARILSRLLPLGLLLVLVLMAGTWIYAGRAANTMLKVRMAGAAQIAAENIPYLLSNGQNLLEQIAGELEQEPDLSIATPAILEARFRRMPYFRELYLVDKTGNLITGYPINSYSFEQSPLEEQLGIPLAAGGVPGQMYAIRPQPGDKAAQVSFIQPLKGQDKQIKYILIGRTELATNPFTQPLFSGLSAFSEAGGNGILIDENNRILAISGLGKLMEEYQGLRGEVPGFYDDTAPNGTRRLVYYMPVTGYPWAVALMVPAEAIQNLAFEIALPLLGIIIALSVVGAGILQRTLKPVTTNLRKLSDEASQISQGKLEQPLALGGDDELGTLSRSFDHMRTSLIARLDEQNRLLAVSQGVASSLEFKDAVQPILDSALATGASSARIVLIPDALPELGQSPSTPHCYVAGPANGHYAYLDEQILAFTRQQDRLVLGSLTRPRLFNLASEEMAPASLVAVALRHENKYYGAFWVAYDQPHRFTNEEVRFLVTLGNQTALAAANARLYQSSEIGRQRLAAILDSSPDPILVTDQHNRMLLANPAAWQVLGLGIQADIGEPIDHVIRQKALLDLLNSSAEETQSIEISMSDKQVYLATVTPVVTEGQHVGRVCVLRDVTRFKELDSLKSEFLSTVSHDLRSPLSLIRGYSTMLEMVGQLNDQQVGYVQNIISNVDTMALLVTNLLDLSRIGAGIGLKLEKVHIREITAAVVIALKAQAAQKRIQIDVNIADNTPEIEADPALLKQAIYNLLENAIKFNRNEGSVSVIAQGRAERMILEIKDTGAGISPMDQARLFEKLPRTVQPGTRGPRTTGLGLAIVKSIAERHHGQVWVESQLGKGSTFSLSIPVRQPKGEKE